MALTIYECILILLHRIKSEEIGRDTWPPTAAMAVSDRTLTHIENSVLYVQNIVCSHVEVLLFGLMSSILFFFLCQNQDLQITSSTQK